MILFLDPEPIALAPRFPGGAQPGRPVHEQTTELHRNQLGRSPVVASSPYRVLIAAHHDSPAATPGQIPRGAAVVAAAAVSAGRGVRVTYALAEERSTGRMVHSCAVRVAGLGWAVWLDGAFSSARAGTTNVNATHFEALAAGREYVRPAPVTPPVKGPCLRCGAAVRWRWDVDGILFLPWKHSVAAAAEGGRNVKVACE